MVRTALARRASQSSVSEAPGAVTVSAAPGVAPWTRSSGRPSSRGHCLARCVYEHVRAPSCCTTLVCGEVGRSRRLYSSLLRAQRRASLRATHCRYLCCSCSCARAAPSRAPRGSVAGDMLRFLLQIRWCQQSAFATPSLRRRRCGVCRGAAHGGPARQRSTSGVGDVACVDSTNEVGERMHYKAQPAQRARASGETPCQWQPIGSLLAAFGSLLAAFGSSWQLLAAFGEVPANGLPKGCQ